jgi:hypothetical protein
VVGRPAGFDEEAEKEPASTGDAEMPPRASRLGSTVQMGDPPQGAHEGHHLMFARTGAGIRSRPMGAGVGRRAGRRARRRADGVEVAFQFTSPREASKADPPVRQDEGRERHVHRPDGSSQGGGRFADEHGGAGAAQGED